MSGTIRCFAPIIGNAAMVVVPYENVVLAYFQRRNTMSSGPLTANAMVLPSVSAAVSAIIFIAAPLFIGDNFALKNCPSEDARNVCPAVSCTRTEEKSLLMRALPANENLMEEIYAFGAGD